MINRCKYKGGVNIWAALASAAAHIFVLGALAALRPGVSQSNQTNAGATVSIRQEIKRQEPIVTPVPKVRTEEVKKPVVRAEPVETKPQPIEKPVEEAVKQSVMPAEAPAVKAAVAAEPVEAASVSLFGDKALCRRVCYVVDCSGSMHGSFGRLCKELSRSIAALKEEQSFYVIFFRDGGQLIESGKGRFAKATMKAKSEAFSLIERIRPAGATLAKDALRRACGIRDEQGRGAEAIYFLTDGFDIQSGGGGPFASEAAAMVRQLSPGAAVCTVGLWPRQQDKYILRELAQATGGRFIDVQTSNE